MVSRSYRGIFPRQTESTARHLFRSSACPRVNVCVCLSVCGLVWDLLNYHSQIRDITVTRILSGENQTLEESSCHFNRTCPRTNYLTSTSPPPSIPSLIWLAKVLVILTLKIYCLNIITVCLTLCWLVTRLFTRLHVHVCK